jgi:hypothetical protein
MHNWPTHLVQAAAILSIVGVSAPEGNLRGERLAEGMNLTIDARADSEHLASPHDLPLLLLNQYPAAGEYTLMLHLLI